MRDAQIFVLLLSLLALGIVIAATAPQTEISNGLVKARLYLPDKDKGFYHGTRFDWSGVVATLEYKGHTYFGQWFSRYDPKVKDVDFDPATNTFLAGTPSAIMGPVEEFNTPLDFNEAKPGGTFIKIGVGVLRKTEAARYDKWFNYEIVNPGTWTVRTGPDWAEFTQELNDDASGYAYVYRKTLRLTKDKPELVLEHSFRNTGKRPIATTVYDHNFFVLDGQPSGPDLVMKFPFEPKPVVDKTGIMAVRGSELVYEREMQRDKDERPSFMINGYSDNPKDYDIRVENRKTGAGVRITSDRPLARLMIWTTRSVSCPEAFISLKAEPGAEFTWRLSYEFSTL